MFHYSGQDGLGRRRKGQVKYDVSTKLRLLQSLAEDLSLQLNIYLCQPCCLVWNIFISFCSETQTYGGTVHG